jgi:hypothetical protein
MDTILAIIAGAAATLFAIDLLVDYRRRPRPHVAAFATGIAMFAIATIALAVELATGWTSASYRTFFLFGAVLNIPFLALGSMFLVVGPRAGHVMTLLLAGFSAISTTLVTTVPFENPLPESGVRPDVFPPLTDGFGPRLLAAIGAGTGTFLLVTLALVSVIRFRKKNPRIVVGNGLILAGTLVAGWGGTGLAIGESSGFVLSLLVTSIMLWAGYRVTRGSREKEPEKPLVVLLGPSTESPERAHAELLITSLEQRGYAVICPARDIEDWGQVTFSPAEMMRQTYQAIDNAAIVLVDLTHGYGVVAAGYANAKRIPVITASPAGYRIPRPIRGISDLEIYYHSLPDITDQLATVLPTDAPAPIPIA